MSSRGIRNHNPGNLRRTEDRCEGLAAEQTDPEFFQFKTPPYGIRALAMNLKAYQARHKLRTIGRIIARWSPPKDKRNDTRAYIAAVADMTGFGVDEELDLFDYRFARPLVEAIIMQENGEQPYSDKEINEGLMLAGIPLPERPLNKSRTIRGGRLAIASAGASGAASFVDWMADHSSDLWETLSPWLPYLKGASVAFVVVTVIAVGVMYWARIDDHRKLRR